MPQNANCATRVKLSNMRASSGGSGRNAGTATSTKYSTTMAHCRRAMLLRWRAIQSPSRASRVRGWLAGFGWKCKVWVFMEKKAWSGLPLLQGIRLKTHQNPTRARSPTTAMALASGSAAGRPMYCRLGVISTWSLRWMR